MNIITNVLFKFISDNSFQELVYLEGWPIDAEGYQQSTENVTVVAIREDEIDLLVGGDWQESKYVTLCLDEDNDLQIKNHSDSLSPGDRFTYWFVSYLHKNGFGNCIVRLPPNNFFTKMAEKLLDPDSTRGLCITNYIQTSKQEFDLYRNK